MKIAICDDDNLICDRLEEVINTASKAFQIAFEVEVFQKGNTLIEKLRQGGRYELIFLDIVLSDSLGTDIALKIREIAKDLSPQIIFISSSHEYGPEAVESGPIKYLLKPLKEEQIYCAIESGLKNISREKRQFEYRVGKQTKCVLLKDIYYFEARDKQIRMVTTRGEEIFYGAISSIEANDLHGFILIHRSYLINFFNLDSYSRSEVVMRNGDLIRIGNTRKEEVEACIMDLAGEYSAGL